MENEHKETEKRWKTWRAANAERVREKRREWRKRNPDKVRAQKKRYYAKNGERYRKANKDKLREIGAKHDKKRRATPSHKLNNRMACMLRKSLRGLKSGRSWTDLVEFTPEELREHIESKFQQGMTWDNISEWHIDHIIPRSAFNFEDEKDVDFKICWSLKNLQPLWRIENLSKGNSLKKPHQPSLLIQLRR